MVYEADSAGFREQVAGYSDVIGVEGVIQQKVGSVSVTQHRR
jgi:ABC-type uncharacterized transport system ATPase subunit